MNFKELFIGNFPPGPQHWAQCYNIHELVKETLHSGKIKQPDESKLMFGETDVARGGFSVTLLGHLRC